jgi:hypothetical protein
VTGRGERRRATTISAGWLRNDDTMLTIADGARIAAAADAL